MKRGGNLLLIRACLLLLCVAIVFYLTVSAQLLLTPRYSLRLSPRDDDDNVAQTPRRRNNTTLHANSRLPSILILTPIKDIKKRTLSRYLDNLAAFDYPREMISIALLEGDSKDDSFERVQRELPKMRQLYSHVELFKYDIKKVSPTAIQTFYGEGDNRHEIEYQKIRRSNLARARNYLLAKALRDEEWVLWMDADVWSHPAQVLVFQLSGKITTLNGPILELIM
jgi:cellulose synthase/poly-beta-1,6-N-acetylglucosamine synthase-like glycosyltransferase